MSSGSCDLLPRESTCKVVWTEFQAKVPPSFSRPDADSPPKKRRRLELLASAVDSTEYIPCGFEPVEPDLSFCLAVVTDGGSPGSEIVVVGLWQKKDVNVTVTEELTRVRLTPKAMCSGELTIDDCCLSLWNGTKPSPLCICDCLFFKGQGRYLVIVTFKPRKLKISPAYWLRTLSPKYVSYVLTR